jgi:hypothetical protein
LLAAALASWDLLSADSRQGMVADIQKDSIDWLNAKPLTDNILRQLFKDDEFAQYTEAFRKEWLSDIPSVFGEFGRYSSGDEVGLYTEFKKNRQAAQAYFEIEDNDEFDELYAEIDAHIEELEAKQPSRKGRPGAHPPWKNPGHRHWTRPAGFSTTSTPRAFLD